MTRPPHQAQRRRREPSHPEVTREDAASVRTVNTVPRIVIRWVTQRTANAFVAQHHSHNDPVRGDLYRAGAYLGPQLVGVGIVGRPVARMLDDGATAEVLRICTDGVPRRVVDRCGEQHTLPICATLYGVLARVWACYGTRLVTYTLAREESSALKGLGWRPVAELPGAGDRGWSRVGRERGHERYTLLGEQERRSISHEAKVRWELRVGAGRRESRMPNVTCDSFGGPVCPSHGGCLVPQCWAEAGDAQCGAEKVGGA